MSIMAIISRSEQKMNSISQLRVKPIAAEQQQRQKTAYTLHKRVSKGNRGLAAAALSAQ